MSIHCIKNIDENLIELLNNIPIGIVIFTQEKNSINTYKISYSNELGRKLLSIPINDDINNFIKNLNNFHEYCPFHKIIETSLYKHIFLTLESSNKIYSNNEVLLYIKVKRIKTKIYVIIDNYDDERKNIQQQLIKNIEYQYLLTLYHEINNPINSLISTLSEISGVNCSTIKSIELLVFLIRLFLKNFILYFRIFSLIQIEKDENSTINLENIFSRISEKFTKLFNYKQINQIKNLEILNDKCANYDYFYFKNLIKMIYVYYYYKCPNHGNFSINIENINKGKTLKIIFSNIKQTTLKFHSNEEILHLEKINETEYSSNIQTLTMIQKIIKKLIKILNIKSEYNLDSKNNNEIIIYIELNEEMTFGNDNELEEFTDKHEDYIRKITRSITSQTNDYTIKNENNNISETTYKSNDSNDCKKVMFNLKFSSFKRHYKRNKTTSFNPIYKNKTFNKKNNFNLNILQNEKENKIQILKKNFEKDEERKIHHFKCRSFNKRNTMFQLRNNIINNLDKEINEIIFEENESHSPNSINENNNFNNKNIYKTNNNDNNNESPLIKNSKTTNYNKLNNNIIFVKQKTFENISKKNELFKNNIMSKKECSCNDVMIVDDEQFNLSCLSNNLKKLNILCDSCTDGEECLNLIKKKMEKNCSCNKSNYKLILLDVVMPKMNGIDAMKNIQKLVDEKKIKDLNVIFISASVDQKIMLDIQKKYFIVKDFLPKPVKISKIKDMVKRYYFNN
jgi:CheY-like chemotaxis protein